ncbi:GAD-like domain protein [Agrobacterium sp. DSM 25558]|uniref:GAD-like domain-containing protein n=1 Tax=Agrobacterium sp. DSM 25558 TaxID=1907665 RepID=UPI0009724289|nr:GAD-like domain-containing protein [Agrobacterium sp. DSM 25558]SCX27327.1 GAD-like domain protein [Agrobacterium sp. DSM 25558]
MQNYQVRLASMIKEFGAPKGGKDIADVERFRSKVPDAMIEFWQLHGTGTILNGYFQFCDPCDYASIVKQIFDGDSQLKPEQTYMLGFGAFGSMVLWNEVYQNVGVDLVRGHVSCQALVSGKTYDPNIAVTSALVMLDDPTFDEYDANAEKLFETARSTLGTLAVGQVYGFKPILAFGGNRALSSLAIYNAKPHMAVLAQAHEMQLMDYDPYPAQPVRVIGG